MSTLSAGNTIKPPMRPSGFAKNEVNVGFGKPKISASSDQAPPVGSSVYLSVKDSGSRCTQVYGKDTIHDLPNFVANSLSQLKIISISFKMVLSIKNPKSAPK